jgi:tRNA pseudouridine38-40 synthase
MRNFKLTVAYDGSEFHGWQIQPGQRTIQGALSEIAGKLTGERVTVHGAGRTDAGVHALGQVANFRTRSGLDPGEFQRAFNALLPATIRVLAAEEVAPEFHARWQAVAKTYRYRIARGRVVSPFAWRYALHYPFSLDEAAMAAAAPLVEGEHDFSSFAASSGSEADDRERSPVRLIFRSELIRREPSGGAGGVPSVAEDLSAGPELVYVVRGRSFLRHMVRKICGTLLEVGRGKFRPEDIPPLFELRDRSRSGPTVAPHGLYLVSVEYPEPWRIGSP